MTQETRFGLLRNSSLGLAHKLHRKTSRLPPKSSPGISSKSSPPRLNTAPEFLGKSPPIPPVSPKSSSADIFERSLSPPANALLSFPPSLPSSRRGSKMANRRSYSVASVSSSGSAIPSHHNTEDFVAPVLDTTTELLADPKTDFSKVQIVCCDFEDEEGSETEKNEPGLPIKGPQSSHCSHHSLAHAGAAPVRPKSRSRSRSKSIISMSLMNSILGAPSVAPSSPTMTSSRTNKSAASLPAPGEYSDQPDPASSHTINFYSYADMVNQEQMSLSSDEPLNIDGRLDNDQKRRFEDYTFATTQPEAAHEPAPDTSGFTTVSMKEYMSGL